VAQADLAVLYALHDHWQVALGDFPDAIGHCDAQDDFIGKTAGQGTIA